MDLSSFVAQNPAGSLKWGETDWLDFCDIEIRSGILCVMDPMLYPGIVLEVHQGSYVVQVRLSNDNGRFITSTMRAIRRGERTRAGDRKGNLGVDFAGVTIGDAVEIEQWGAKITSFELAQPILKSIEAATLFGYIPWNADATLRTPFVRTPGGDGRFRVDELVSDSGRAGAQIVFTEHGA